MQNLIKLFIFTTVMVNANFVSAMTMMTPEERAVAVAQVEAGRVAHERLLKELAELTMQDVERSRARGAYGASGVEVKIDASRDELFKQKIIKEFRAYPAANVADRIAQAEAKARAEADRK